MAKDCSDCPLAIIGSISCLLIASALILVSILGIVRFNEMSEQLHSLEKYRNYHGTLNKDLVQKELEIPDIETIKYLQDDVNTLFKYCNESKRR